MTAAASEDWGAVVETLRRDLEAVSSGDARDEEVRAAMDEVWSIVDVAEERVGSVDAEQIGDVLGVDGGADSIDVESISREFVLEDPQRAAGLGRLVTLINVDEATGYDVGRLWRDEEVGSTESGDGDSSGGGDSSGEADAESPPAGESTDEGSTSDAGEAIRSELGEALSQFRERIQDARDGLDDPTDRVDDANRSEGGAGDDGTAADSGADGSSSRRRSTSSGRSSTTISTMPSERHDMGDLTHVSTMPGRAGRSRSSNPFGRGDEEYDRSDDE